MARLTAKIAASAISQLDLKGIPGAGAATADVPPGPGAPPDAAAPRRRPRLPLRFSSPIRLRRVLARRLEAPKGDRQLWTELEGASEVYRRLSLLPEGKAEQSQSGMDSVDWWSFANDPRLLVEGFLQASQLDESVDLHDPGDVGTAVLLNGSFCFLQCKPSILRSQSARPERAGIDNRVRIALDERSVVPAAAKIQCLAIVEEDEPPIAESTHHRCELRSLGPPVEEDEGGVDSLEHGCQGALVMEGAAVLAVELLAVNVVTRIHGHPYRRVEPVNQVAAGIVAVERIAMYAVRLEIVGGGNGSVRPESEAKRSVTPRAERGSPDGEPAGKPEQNQRDPGQEGRLRGPVKKPRLEPCGRRRDTRKRRQPEVGHVSVHAQRQRQKAPENQKRESPSGCQLPSFQGERERGEKDQAADDDPCDVIPHRVGAGESAREGRKPLVVRLHEHRASGQLEGKGEQAHTVGIDDARSDESCRQHR